MIAPEPLDRCSPILGLYTNCAQGVTSPARLVCALHYAVPSLQLHQAVVISASYRYGEDTSRLCCSSPLCSAWCHTSTDRNVHHQASTWQNPTVPCISHRTLLTRDPTAIRSLPSFACNYLLVEQ